MATPRPTPGPTPMQSRPVYQSSQTNRAAANYRGSQTQPGGLFNQRNSVLGSTTIRSASNNAVPPPSGGGGGGGGGGGPSEGDYNAELDRQIEEMYNSGMGTLDAQSARLRAEEPGDEAMTIEQYNNMMGKATTERDQNLSDTNTNQDKTNRTIMSALEAAYNAYNALQQQKNARFGGGSSAGEAVGELAQKEFYKQQGDVTQKQLDTNGAFDEERKRIKTFAQQKFDDLDLYKNQAIEGLKKTLSEKLNEIELRKGDLAMNKSRDKISVLQDTINRARDIADQAKQLRSQISLAAISQMQETAGRAFTPQEIQVLMSEFDTTQPSLGGGTVGGNGSVTYARNPNLRRQQGYDEFGQPIA